MSHGINVIILYPVSRGIVDRVKKQEISQYVAETLILVRTFEVGRKASGPYKREEGKTKASLMFLQLIS